MSALPTARQAQILDWLQDQPTLSIEELADRLQVSVMTIHRDLNELARGGHVEKVHGGVMLARPAPAAPAASPVCRLCDLPVNQRTAVVIQMAAGQTHFACCPHCGLLLLQEGEAVQSALARDFLYGRMVNATQAVYLIESEVRLCCVPSVLCFETRRDAERFQRGFGGSLASFEQALALILERHSGIPGCH